MLMSLFVLPVYDGAKMERVSEVLQLPVIVEGRRPLALELQPLEKLDFLRGRRAAERRILEEFLEPGLLADRLFGFPLDKLESLRLPDHAAVAEDNLQRDRRHALVHGHNRLRQERDELASGHLVDAGTDVLEHHGLTLPQAPQTHPSAHLETQPIGELERLVTQT